MDDKHAILKRTSYRDYLTEDLRLQRGGARSTFRAARSDFSGSAATRCRRPMRAISAIRVSPGSSCRKRATRRGASPTSIISPMATRRSRGSWCVRLFPAPPRATRWTMSCRPRSTTARSTAPASRSAFASNSTCVHVARAGDKAQVAYVRDGTLHRVETRHAVLACFHMMIPAHHAGVAGAAARRACQERQDADLLHQRVGAELAGVRPPQGQLHHRADVVPSSVALDFPVSLGGIRHPRTPMSRCCSISRMCPARRTRDSTRALNSASGRASSTP